MLEKNGQEFVISEYQAAFEQLRYYDSRHTDSVKYSVALASSAVAALLAFYKLYLPTQSGGVDALSPPAQFWRLSALLAGLVFVGTLLLFIWMVQNREYFCRIARQMNAIRDFYLSNEAGSFASSNRLWRDADKPEMIHWGSLQCTQIALAALIPSVFLGYLVGSLCHSAGYAHPILTGIVVGIVWAILIMGLAVWYLLGKSTDADKIKAPGYRKGRRT